MYVISEIYLQITELYIIGKGRICAQRSTYSLKAYHIASFHSFKKSFFHLGIAGNEKRLWDENGFLI